MKLKIMLVVMFAALLLIGLLCACVVGFAAEAERQCAMRRDR